MKGKFNLSSADILEKRFSVELKGYDAREVDYFLDLIRKDYEMWNLVLKYHLENSKKLKEVNDHLVKENKILQNHLENLKVQMKELEVKGLGNIDIIKRLNELEERDNKK